MGATGRGGGASVARRRIDPVWRHSPWVLLRYPALFAAVAFGTLLLTVAATAYPLFLSATSSDLVRSAIGRPNITRYGAGMTYTFNNLPLDPIRLRPGKRSPSATDLDEPFRRLAAGSPVLDESIEAILGEKVDVSVGGGETREGRLFASTGVLNHVEVLAGHEGPGVWLPDLIADALGAGPGDTIDLEDAGGGTASVPVDGVYRAVYRTSLGGYWLQWQESFQVPCPDCSPLPQPILGDRDQVLALARELEQDSVTATWQAPLRDEAIGLEEARAFERFQQDVRQRMGDRRTPLGHLFDCCGNYFIFGQVGTSLRTSIGLAIKEARERIVAVEGPSRVLETAAIAVALVVVAAAGAFSLRTRRVEAAWLFARGTSSASVGTKSALESLLPCVAGGLLGAAIAVAAVELLGPGGRVEGGAFADARLAAAASVAIAVALIAFVSARTYGGVVDPHGRRLARLTATIPWELGLAALAFLALRHLRDGGAFATDEALGVLKPSLALVAYPFLFVSAFSILAARLGRLAVARLRGPTAGSSPATYLATRRLASSGAFGVLLVAAAGLCLGTLVHAQIVSRSLETTVDAKAGVFVGADVAGDVDYGTPVPETFPYPLTRVVRFGAGARTPAGRPLDLLAVDATTLASAAYWQEGFSDVPIEELAERLLTPDGGRVPMILAGGGGLTLDDVEIATVELPIDVVERTAAFPGMYSLNPTLVVDERTLLGTVDFPFNPLNDARANTELWVRGEPGAVRDAFADVPFPPSAFVTAAQIRDIPYISAAINTFVVVNALGLVAGALTLVGLLMYLQARQRSQVVSYALSRRMGLRHAEHRRALVLELGAMLAWAFAVGAALAFAAARTTVPFLDPIASIPPDPLLIVPLAAIGVAGAVVAAFAWVGAALTNRRARGVDLAEVMRVAE